MMNLKLTLRRTIVSVGLVVLVIGAYLVHALAGLNASAILFEEPPAFVERYATTLAENQASQIVESKAQDKKITEDYQEEEALVHQVIFKGAPPELLLNQFRHPEKSMRVKIAMAFAAVNVEFTHNEESGYPEKREQFWKDVEAHTADIQNALFEALIMSAEENTSNYIPYTLAWMPGQGEETVELFAWAASHHPDWWIRRFSVYFVVKFGGNEELAAMLLSNRTHDPDYRVRKEVLDLRIERLTGLT